MDADEKMPFNPIFQSGRIYFSQGFKLDLKNRLKQSCEVIQCCPLGPIFQQVTYCTWAMAGPVAESGNTPEIIPPGQMQGPDGEKHLMQKA